MTLFSDKNNNTTIVSPDGTDIISSRMHYLHPEYIDEKSKFIYSQSRCPLSMLAETCKNVGKPVIDNAIFPSQEPSVSISPSCSSSCSAPKFSPHSLEYSPVEQSKLMEGSKEKSTKDNNKSKKRKSQKKEPETATKRPLLDPQMLHSNYAISEFLKMNNISRDGFSKSDPNNLGIPLYNHLINQNIVNRFNHSSSIWKSKPSQNHRMTFPLNYLPQNYPPPNIPMQNGMYRCPPPNLLHDLNQFYPQCPVEKPICDCLACNGKKNIIDKNLIKIEPLLFNFFQNLHKDRSINSSTMSILSFLQNSNHFLSGASAIKYCMYCGQCIPLIQNLLNHIHTEHIDCVNSNLCPKLDSVGNFSSNFNVDNLQSKEPNINNLHSLKNIELLKHLQYMYNNNIINNNNNINNNNTDEHHQVDNCTVDKPVLMK